METNKKQLYDVEVFNGSTLITSIRVEAESHEQASKQAFEIFTSGIKAQTKRAYN